jgi:tetratricopeptide (TPR) repeat protein
LFGAASLARRTPEEMARAREWFEESIRQDQRNAYAFSGLSKYYSLAEIYRYQTGARDYQAAGLALAFARRAIELEPNLADGYSARSILTRRSFAPNSVVESDCLRAMELEPGAAEGLAWCAPLLRLQGEDDQGLRAAHRAIAMDPQSPGRRVTLALIALATGDHAVAATQARMAWQLEHQMMLPRALEAWALLLSGNAAECTTRELGPHEVIRATCLQEMGLAEQASAIVDSVRQALETRTLADSVYTEVNPMGDLAVHYAWMGDSSESLRWLERVYNLSPMGMDQKILASDLFDRVREDDEFSEGLSRIQSGIWERVQAAAETAYQGQFRRRDRP